jgi:hypothetical protein
MNQNRLVILATDGLPSLQSNTAETGMGRTKFGATLPQLMKLWRNYMLLNEIEIFELRADELASVAGGPEVANDPGHG